MKVELTESSATQKVFNIIFPKEEVKRRIDKKYNEYGPQIKLDGFRPGKVPKSLIRQRFKEPINNEVTQKFIQESYEEIKNKHDFNIVGQPDIDYDTIDVNKDFSLTLRLEVEPEVELKQYKDFELEQPEVEVTDEDVESRLAYIRKNYSEWIPVERAVQEEDVVTIEYSVPNSDETKEEDIYIEKDNEDVLEKFVGKEIGDEVELGDELTANIVDLKEVRLRELNQEFFRMAGSEAESLADFKAKIRDNLIAVAERTSKHQLEQLVLEKLVEANPVEVPPSQVENFAQSRLNRYSANFDSMSDEAAKEMKDRLWAQAARDVAQRLILLAVAADVNLKVEQEELQAKVESLAAQFGYEATKLFAELRASDRLEGLKEEIMIEKTLDYIITNSQIIKREKDNNKDKEEK